MNRNLKTNGWKIDGTIDLDGIGMAADWHHATVIEKLIEAGLSHEDASAFASFAGHDFCILNGGKADGRADDYLTDEQFARLDCRR